jgi:hypothetical protein
VLQNCDASCINLAECTAPEVKPHSDFASMIIPLRILHYTQLDDATFTNFQHTEVKSKFKLVKESVGLYYAQTKKDFELLRDGISTDVESFIARAKVFLC